MWMWPFGASGDGEVLLQATNQNMFRGAVKVHEGFTFSSLQPHNLYWVLIATRF